MAHNSEDKKESSPPAVTLPPKTIIASSTHDAFVIESQDAAKVAGIVVAVLYLACAPVTVISLITMAAAIAALYIPGIFPDAPTVFEGLSTKISQLVIPAIEQSQTKVAISNANAALEANVKKCKNTATLFDTWMNSPNAQLRADAKTHLQSDYAALSRDYLADLTQQFTSELFRGILVPQYVASAATYLPLLVCYYTHGEALGIVPRPGFLTVQESLLTQFRNTLAQITDTAVASYKHGLQKILHTPASHQLTWLDYNDYRNTVTRTGLDLLAGLIFLDPAYYPNGCSPKHLTRHLYTFVNTSRGKQTSNLIKNISTLDILLTAPLPVMRMKSFELKSGRFVHNEDLHHLIDGVYSATVLSESIDGYSWPYDHLETGQTAEEATIQFFKKWPTQLDMPCLSANGRFWNGDMNESIIIPPNTILTTPYTHTITELELFLHSEEGNRDRHVQLQNLRSELSVSEKEATNLFEAEIPPITDVITLPGNILPLSRQYRDCLANFIIVDEHVVNLHHYAFTWSNLSALQSLLPKSNHVSDPKKNPTEQFHAIKAAFAITVESLQIIPGPGFTGGDLVEVQSGTSLYFVLSKQEGHWFNGSYSARLWVINPYSVNDPHRGVVDVYLAIRPTGFMESTFTASVPPSAQQPDLNNLKHGDLVPIPLFGTALIPSSATSVTLEFSSIMPGMNIILDRFELTFEEIATQDEINQATTTGAQPG